MTTTGYRSGQRSRRNNGCFIFSFPFLHHNVSAWAREASRESSQQHGSAHGSMDPDGMHWILMARIDAAFAFEGTYHRFDVREHCICIVLMGKVPKGREEVATT